jgi:adenylate cyclase class 2
MANIIEMEESFVVDDFENIMKKIQSEGFEFVDENIEEDTYYTDPEEIFIKDRICLRTRKTNDEKLELTYKPKTDNRTEQYGKKESNVAIKVSDYNDIQYIINELGYQKYVSFKKNRKTYTKTIDGIEHNIMLDTIDDVGKYIELEMIVHTKEEQENSKKELDNFVERMGCSGLKPKDRPYRDIVKLVKG